MLKLATLPGLVAPGGTVQASLYVPAGDTVALRVAEVPEHTVELFKVTDGAGFIVTALVTAAPAQFPMLGVMVNTTVPAVAPEAVSVWEIALPLPFDAPVALDEICVQANVAPVGVPVIASAVTSPEHMVDEG